MQATHPKEVLMCFDAQCIKKKMQVFNNTKMNRTIHHNHPWQIVSTNSAFFRVLASRSQPAQIYAQIKGMFEAMLEELKQLQALQINFLRRSVHNLRNMDKQAEKYLELINQVYVRKSQGQSITIGEIMERKMKDSMYATISGVLSILKESEIQKQQEFQSQLQPKSQSPPSGGKCKLQEIGGEILEGEKEVENEMEKEIEKPEVENKSLVDKPVEDKPVVDKPKEEYKQAKVEKPVVEKPKLEKKEKKVKKIEEKEHVKRKGNTDIYTAKSLHIIRNPQYESIIRTFISKGFGYPHIRFQIKESISREEYTSFIYRILRKIYRLIQRAAGLHGFATMEKIKGHHTRYIITKFKNYKEHMKPQLAQYMDKLVVLLYNGKTDEIDEELENINQIRQIYQECVNYYHQCRDIPAGDLSLEDIFGRLQTVKKEKEKAARDKYKMEQDIDIDQDQ